MVDHLVGHPLENRMSSLAAFPIDADPAADARPGLAEVTEKLRDRIVGQALAPGERLRERQLAAEFGVSRAVIRDALSNLTQRHLVVRYPNRGAEVVRLGPAEIRAIYEVRETVEGLCARLATQRTPAGFWRDLVDLFDAPAASAIRTGRFDLYSSYIARLDARMKEAADNDVLAEMLNALADRSAVLARRSVLLPGRAEQGLVLHRAVLEAMNRGDAEAAERLKRENLRLARDMLLRFEAFVR